jgi:hypothetical protein
MTEREGYNHGLITVVREARPYLVNCFTYFLKKDCRALNNFKALACNNCAADSERFTKSETLQLWRSA